MAKCYDSLSEIRCSYQGE